MITLAKLGLFQCFLCEHWKLTRKKSRGELVIRGSDGEKRLLLCESCFNSIDQTYDENKAICDMQIVEPSDGR